MRFLSSREKSLLGMSEALPLQPISTFLPGQRLSLRCCCAPPVSGAVIYPPFTFGNAGRHQGRFQGKQRAHRHCYLTRVFRFSSNHFILAWYCRISLIHLFGSISVCLNFQNSWAGTENFVFVSPTQAKQSQSFTL